MSWHKVASMSWHRTAQSRKVDAFGNIGYKAGRFKVGRGLAGERVVIAESQSDCVVRFFDTEIGYLEDLRV